MRSTEPSNVFEWLDEARRRPGMYLGETHTPLQDLEKLIHGYSTALHVHGIVEPVPDMSRHFSPWLRLTTSWSTSCGWAAAISEHCEPDRALARFFELVDEYRKLAPRILASATLDERHQPRGTRARIGLDGRIARPDRVDVVRYVPSPLHFLRFHYGQRVVDQDTLLTSTGSDATTLDDAETWVEEELGVARDAWQPSVE